MSKPRGGGNNRNKGPLPRAVQISKKLSWLLRHGAESESLPLQPGGYINLADALSNRNLRGLKITLAEVREIVETQDKQRFTMIPVSSNQATTASNGEGSSVSAPEPNDNDNNHQQTHLPSTDPKDYLIRANQGHSIKIADEGLLQPLDPSSTPPLAVHGTTHAAWPLILASGGLKPMKRNHVHFASGLPAGFKSVAEQTEGEETQQPVISGMRNSSTVLIFLDVGKAMEEGLKFWRSDNGVILSEGDVEGVVGVKFFKRVEDRMGEGVLVEDGVVVKEAPAHCGKGKGRGKG